MHFRRVYLESFGYTLPDEIVTTAEIERRLAPLYDRLRLPAGRLELMTGIRERRFFPSGSRPGTISIESARRAIDASRIDPRFFGALVHGSVCRDFLEPATACRVHHGLKLPAETMIYDVSNACLGLLNGIIQVANMIELGQIRAGVVAGTECGRELVENTIETLNHDRSLTRESIKDSIASLTIGSASAAIVLCDEELMRQGIAAGVATFDRFLAAAGWEADDIDRTFCHQVGVAHRKLMFESLQLDPAIDFTTVETLGNTGAVALPITMALGIEQGGVRSGERVAMLGIGSGINCLMLAAEWQRSPQPQQVPSIVPEHPAAIEIR